MLKYCDIPSKLIDNKDKKEESREEKWQREQEEMKNWNSGLIS